MDNHDWHLKKLFKNKEEFCLLDTISFVVFIEIINSKFFLLFYVFIILFFFVRNLCVFVNYQLKFLQIELIQPIRLRLEHLF